LQLMHFLPFALSPWLGQIAMQNSEHGIGAAIWVRAVDLSAEQPGWENCQRRSREMMTRERHCLSGWGSSIECAHLSSRNKAERTTNKQNKRMTSKQD
jgi:hypothetical protein